MNKVGCPVCGYQEITVLDEFNETTFEICGCCGCEAGYSYDQRTSQEDLKKLRDYWFIDNNFKFWRGEAPKNWNPIRQMKESGIDVSKYENF